MKLFISPSSTDDRSHVIERSMNRRTGAEERKQDFINLDESEFFVIFSVDTMCELQTGRFLFKPHQCVHVVLQLLTTS